MNFHCKPIEIPDIDSGQMKALFKTLAVSTGLLLFGAASFTGCGGLDEEEVGEVTEEGEEEASAEVDADDGEDDEE